MDPICINVKGILSLHYDAFFALSLNSDYQKKGGGSNQIRCTNEVIPQTIKKHLTKRCDFSSQESKQKQIMSTLFCSGEKTNLCHVWVKTQLLWNPKINKIMNVHSSEAVMSPGVCVCVLVLLKQFKWGPLLLGLLCSCTILVFFARSWFSSPIPSLISVLDCLPSCHHHRA